MADMKSSAKSAESKRVSLPLVDEILSRLFHPMPERPIGLPPDFIPSLIADKEAYLISLTKQILTYKGVMPTLVFGNLAEVSTLEDEIGELRRMQAADEFAILTAQMYISQSLSFDQASETSYLKLFRDFEKRWSLRTNADIDLRMALRIFSKVRWLLSEAGSAWVRHDYEYYYQGIKLARVDKPLEAKP